MDANGSATFWHYVGLVVRRALKDFQWTRDMLIGIALAICSIFLQAHWNLIPVSDWHEHKSLWLLSIVLPYSVIVSSHFVWRFVQAPWRIYQTQESEARTVEVSLRQQLESTKARLDTLSLPVNRPKLVIERWGPVVVQNVLRPDIGTGFYIVNHGGAALDVKNRPFFVGGEKWIGETIPSLQANDKAFMRVASENTSPIKADLHQSLKAAASSPDRASPDYKVAVILEYRDFDNIAYRSVADVTYLASKDVIQFNPPHQERIGFSS